MSKTSGPTLLLVASCRPRSQAAEGIAEALAIGPGVGRGLFVRPAVFEIERGPSGDREVLCLIHGMSSYGGYWYGHVQKRVAGGFTAAVVRVSGLIDAETVEALFVRFDEVVRRGGSYEPPSVSAEWQGYAESVAYEGACAALARMVIEFDLTMRNDRERVARLDTRVLGVYGFGVPVSDVLEE